MLQGIVKGKLARPMRVLIHGTEGVGKSTFAADAPRPVFICAEDGTAQLDIDRLPEPPDWATVLRYVDELEKGGHQYKTVVLDTLDWLEPLCWEHVCKAGKKDSIEDFGYGKGYTAALEQWRLLLSKLDRLRASGMHVVLVAHSWIRPFANPEGDNYDRYELKLHKAAAGLLKEWADAVLFATWESATVKDGSKAKGISTGSRIMRTERRAAFDAKNRYGLPFEMPLSWGEFFAAVQKGEPMDAAKLVSEAQALGERLGIAEAVAKHLAAANGDVKKLAKLVDWARGKASQKEHSNAA